MIRIFDESSDYIKEEIKANFKVFNNLNHLIIIKRLLLFISKILYF